MQLTDFGFELHLGVIQKLPKPFFFFIFGLYYHFAPQAQKKVTPINFDQGLEIDIQVSLSENLFHTIVFFK